MGNATIRIFLPNNSYRLYTEGLNCKRIDTYENKVIIEFKGGNYRTFGSMPYDYDHASGDEGEEYFYDSRNKGGGGGNGCKN